MTEQNAEKKVSFIKKYNVIPKIICVLGAFILWIYVAQAETTDTERTFSGVIVNLDNTAILASENGLTTYSGYGNVAEVTVVGRKNVIRDFTTDDLRVSVDLSTVKEAGDHELALKVSLRDGMTLSSISPETITIHVDKEVRKDVEVQVGKITSGGVENDYNLTTEPQYTSISVTGPKQVVDDIAYAVVNPDFGSEKLSRTLTVSADVEFTSLSDSTVDLRDLKYQKTIEVTARLETTKVVPLAVSFKYGYLNEENVAVSPETVKISGDPAVLAEIDELMLDPPIDEKNVEKSETLTRDITAPSGVRIADGNSKATIFIELPEDTVTRIYTVNTFTVRGADDLKYELTTESIRVSVRGSLAELGKITANDISAVIDLGNYDASFSGSVKLPVEIAIDSDTVYEIDSDSYFAEVTIG